jgi:hypothetical protein
VVVKPTLPGADARVFLDLQSGLLLPRFSVTKQEDPNQKLIDAAFVRSGTGVALATLRSSAVVVPLSRWPLTNRRATQLRRTTLGADAFTAAGSTGALVNAFAGGQAFSPDSLSTEVLAKDNVVAFRTTGGKFGLLRIANLVSTAGVPVLTCNVRVQK